MSKTIDETQKVPTVPVPEWAMRHRHDDVLEYFGTEAACRRCAKSNAVYEVVRLDWAGFIRKHKEAK